MITDWMLSDNKRLASAAATLLTHLSARKFKNPEFTTQRLDFLEHNDLLFLARRMLGFVYSEDDLLSLTMSFLKTRSAPQRVFGIARTLFVDELGKDYPSSTIKILESACEAAIENEWKDFYTSTASAIKSHISALEALPRLIELCPSPVLQRQFAKARAKQMSKVIEKAREGSIFRQITTEIPIKAGIGWFSFHDGNYTDVMRMQSFSHSVAIPLRETTDPIGSEINRLFLRNIKREDS